MNEKITTNSAVISAVTKAMLESSSHIFLLQKEPFPIHIVWHRE